MQQKVKGEEIRQEMFCFVGVVGVDVEAHLSVLVLVTPHRHEGKDECCLLAGKEVVG
jgi:hypothetical protein